MARVIIGIHGLGNNPPADIVHKWWQESIYEGFRAAGYRLPWFKFNMVYWTDVLHPGLLDPNERDEYSPRYIESPYTPGVVFKPAQPGKFRQKALDLLEERMDKIFLKKDFTMQYISFTDKILQKFFQDLDAYYSAKVIIDGNNKVYRAPEVIRQRLIKELLKNKRNRILLIGHSMGSIVAYDILSRGLEGIQVHTLVTIGSPLGLPVVRGKFAEEMKKNNQIVTALKTPAAVKNYWFNLSDLKDKVAINYNLANNYGENEHHVRVVDKIIENNYSYHGKANPHKSFGYLRAPEMAEILYTFLTRDRNRFALLLNHLRYLAVKTIKKRVFKEGQISDLNLTLESTRQMNNQAKINRFF